MHKNRFGLSVVVMPFVDDRPIGLPRLLAYAWQPLAVGCMRVALLGTTSEGPSLNHNTNRCALGAQRYDPLAWSRMSAPLVAFGEPALRRLAAVIDAMPFRQAA